MKTVTKRSAALLLLSLLMVVTAQAAMIKGPYLIYPGVNTQMTVLWQLDFTEGCTVDWGLDTSYSSGSIGTNEYDGYSHQHSATLTGLTPGSKYFYRVLDSGGYSYGDFTAAPAASATDVKFLMYGDTRSNPGDHDWVASRLIATYNADPACQTMITHSGDFVNGDWEDDWTNTFFNYYYGNIAENLRRMPIQGCMGNHEGGGGTFTKYYPYPYVAARYWSFDYGPVHISIVDQYTNYSPGSAQYNWLVNDLSSSTKLWKIIVLHQPGWSAGSHGNDGNVQNYIQPLCLQYGVQMVVGGHNHYYARADVDGVQHITSGGGGAPLYGISGGAYIVSQESTLNFQKVEISGNSLTCTSYRPDGSVIDTFNLGPPGPPPEPLPYLSNYNSVAIPGSHNGWNAAGDPMTIIADYTWEGTITFGSAASHQYKFAMNGSWGINRGLGSSSGPSLPQSNTNLTQDGGNIAIDVPADTVTFTYYENSESSEADSGAPPPPTCGDSTCDPGEDCVSCEADCGPCPPTCGDSTCDPGEDCASCEADCGPCPPPEGGMTVHAEYTHIYYWNTADGTTTWPGIAMTSESGGWYYYTFATSTCADIVFSNNGSQQTSDLYRCGDGWYQDGTWYDSQPTGPPLSNYSSVAIPGSHNGWNAAGDPMTLIADYTWEGSITFGSSGSHEYKFAMNGGWGTNRGLGSSSGPNLPQDNWNLTQSGGNIAINVPAGTVVFTYNESTEESTAVQQ